MFERLQSRTDRAKMSVKEDGGSMDRLVEALAGPAFLCRPETGMIIHLNGACRTLLMDKAALSFGGDGSLSVDIFDNGKGNASTLVEKAAGGSPGSATMEGALGVVQLTARQVRDTGTRDSMVLLECWPASLSRRAGERPRSGISAGALQTMVDKMPINAMMCDPKSLELIYMNEMSKKTLKELEVHLPVSADNLIGQCIDVFHKNPSHQRRILGDPSNLPFTAKIKLGPEILKLDITGILDDDDTYVGALATWAVVTKTEQAAAMVTEKSQSLEDEAASASAAVEQMSSAADETMHLASMVAAAAEEAMANVQTVAAATEELSVTGSDIANQATQASDVASSAADRAERAAEEVSALQDASDRIGRVLSLISEISHRTRLLALNATIEATRAGESGKGFAVVAHEIKALANQTSSAVDDITHEIETVQGEVGNTVSAIGDIRQRITEVDTIASAIASHVGEQTTATSEIAANSQEAAAGTMEVSKHIQSVRVAVERANESVSSLQGTTETLNGLSSVLRGEIGGLLN